MRGSHPRAAFSTFAQFSNDLDGDGQPEIFISAQHGSGSNDDYASIFWLFFDGHHLQVKYELTLIGVNILSELYIHPFDIDNDGFDELNINYGRTILMLKWSDANNEFKIYNYQDTGSGSISFINFEDVNNDQSPDLFVGIMGPSPYTS